MHDGMIKYKEKNGSKRAKNIVNTVSVNRRPCIELWRIKTLFICKVPVFNWRQNSVVSATKVSDRKSMSVSLTYNDTNQRSKTTQRASEVRKRSRRHKLREFINDQTGCVRRRSRRYDSVALRVACRHTCGVCPGKSFQRINQNVRTCVSTSNSRPVDVSTHAATCPTPSRRVRFHRGAPTGNDDRRAQMFVTFDLFLRLTAWQPLYDFAALLVEQKVNETHLQHWRWVLFTFCSTSSAAKSYNGCQAVSRRKGQRSRTFAPVGRYFRIYLSRLVAADGYCFHRHHAVGLLVCLPKWSDLVQVKIKIFHFWRRVCLQCQRHCRLSSFNDNATDTPEAYITLAGNYLKHGTNSHSWT